ncbi:MAG: DJ-1/PfpI family protein [Steroidobacteraceae bacterium]
MAETTVVFAMYPNVTQLDATGPFEVFSRLPDARCVLASVEGGTVECSGGLALTQVVRLADVPSCTLLCVPGGYGCIAAMEDEAYLAALRRLAGTARYVTAVCTGSLLLGAAGLLRGRRAACHWAWRGLLTEFGAIPDSQRVVQDGSIFTGGGVTAGIDLALSVMAEMAGPAHAQAVQLTLEYAPAPPFDGGRPETARPEILRAALARVAAVRAERDAAVRRAAQRIAMPGTPQGVE